MTSRLLCYTAWPSEIEREQILSNFKVHPFSERGTAILTEFTSLKVYSFPLTLKMQEILHLKMSSAEYSCKLFRSIFAYRQTVWTLIRLLLEEQSDPGPHCLQKWLLKSQADDKADDKCCDWQFKC